MKVRLIYDSGGLVIEPLQDVEWDEGKLPFGSYIKAMRFAKTSRRRRLFLYRNDYKWIFKDVFIDRHRLAGLIEGVIIINTKSLDRFTIRDEV